MAPVGLEEFDSLVTNKLWIEITLDCRWEPVGFNKEFSESFLNVGTTSPMHSICSRMGCAFADENKNMLVFTRTPDTPRNTISDVYSDHPQEGVNMTGLLSAAAPLYINKPTNCEQVFAVVGHFYPVA